MSLFRCVFLVLLISSVAGAEEAGLQTADPAADLTPETTPRPFPEFQSKTVKPPKPGTARRITVQIVPIAPKPPETAAATQDETGPVGRYEAFWQDISPARTDSGPGRLAPAVLRAGQLPGLVPPRLQDLQDIVAAHGVPLLLETVNTQVSPALVLAVIAVESGGRTDAISPAGAEGVMQLTRETATRFEVGDPFDAAQNIAGGVKYLDWLMQTFDGDPILVLAGYNAGAGAVKEHDGVPPFAETRDYVPKVLAAFQVARGLCQTPPELISDGCVFHIMK